MTLEELKEDLINKTDFLDTIGIGYFSITLFKNDKIYCRRSFDDLFKYYKRFGVTEKLLLKGLHESNFIAKVCLNIDKVIFYRSNTNHKERFWAKNVSYGYSSDRVTENTKYTAGYLDNLFKEIYNE